MASTTAQAVWISSLVVSRYHKLFPSPLGVWTQSHSNVRAAVQGEGCRMYPRPWPLLCLEVEHKSFVIGGCPVCFALTKQTTQNHSVHPRSFFFPLIHLLFPFLPLLEVLLSSLLQDHMY